MPHALIPAHLLHTLTEAAARTLPRGDREAHDLDEAVQAARRLLSQVYGDH